MVKRFINIVIDSLNPQTFIKCLHNNKAPALKFLVDNGRMSLKCVSAFPTMTPVAAASIATGALVDKHRLPGFIWYDHSRQRKINYGATKKAVIKLGTYRVIQDFLYDLNHRHLNPAIPTIYEILEKHRIDCGVVNFFCFRGLTAHQVKIPLSIMLLSKLRLSGDVMGPSRLILGKLVNQEPKILNYLKWEKRYGFNDAYSFRATYEMLKSRPAPLFFIIYFPDNDKLSHSIGPANSEASITRVDKYIGELLSVFGSWQKAIRENVFLVLGDHSQSQVSSDGLALINLEKLLGEFGSEIMICPNERMAYLHSLNTDLLGRNVAELLVKDSRIGLAAWKEGQEILVKEGGSDKGLVFYPGHQVTDEMGVKWNFRGDLSVLDGRVEAGPHGEKVLFGDYPDAFSRLAGVLNWAPDNTAIVSARPGYEFFCDDAPTHVGGGSHGSLHQNDSLVPLIITGSELWPEHLSITGLKNLWCKHFGVSPQDQGR